MNTPIPSLQDISCRARDLSETELRSVNGLLQASPTTIASPARTWKRCLNDKANQEALWMSLCHIQHVGNTPVATWFRYFLEESKEVWRFSVLHRIVDIIGTYCNLKWIQWSVSLLLNGGAERVLRKQLERLQKLRLTITSFSTTNHSVSNRIRVLCMRLQRGSPPHVFIESLHLYNYKPKVIRLILKHMSTAELLTLILHPRKESMPTAYRRFMASDAFAKRALECQLECLVRVRRFIRSLNPLTVSDCTICWETRPVHALHDEQRHSVCFPCKQRLLDTYDPVCPMCRHSLPSSKIPYVYEEDDDSWERNDY